MKKIIKYVTLMSLFLNTNCLEKNRLEIDKVEISSINWSIVTKTAIPVVAFWNRKSPMVSCKYLSIENEEELFDYLVNKINALSKGIKNDQGIDTRISMLIFYKDITIPDTLSFGRTNKMKLNSSSYNIDVELLKKISQYLSELEKIAIESEF